MPASTLYEKLEWRAREYATRLRMGLVRRGLFAGTREYQPFIVLCGIRTGSTMLASFLRSHPNALMFSELFHPDRSRVSFGVEGFRHKAQDPEIIRLRNTDPVRFLQKEVFQAYPANVEAVGFKLMYDQARAEEMWWDDPRYADWWDGAAEGRTDWHEADSDLWAHLRSRTDVKIIHLVRENFLRQKVSARMAAATETWNATSPSGDTNTTERPQVEIDPDTCKRDFAAVERMRREAEQEFGNHALLRSSYEKIVDNPREELRRIQRFLGLDVEPLQTETRKQEKRPLDKVISNYSELREALENTRWIQFFDE